MNLDLSWMGLAYQSIYQKFIRHNFLYYDVLRDRHLLDGVHTLLSIGAGEGQLEIQLAEEYGLQLGYIDRAESMVCAFNDRVKDKAIEDLILESHLGDFETYDPKNRYDLVIAIHSWYSIRFNQEMLEKALDLVEPAGRFFVSLTSEQDQFKQQVWSHPLWAEDFSSWARSAGFGHEFFTKAVPLQVADFFESGDLTHDALAYVGFLNGTKWNDLPISMKQGAREFLQRCEVDGKIQKVDGCLVFQK